MRSLRNLFATQWGVILAGGLIGVMAVTLQKMGNPANMGICAACFERDIAGGVGLHRAAPVQYVRPEIIGMVLGALVAAYLFREFRPRAGSAPVVRFVLGAFAMIGALVFLGCPWRVMLRLAGGDGNAIFGLLGLVFGIWIGTRFFRRGFSLGRAHRTHTAAGWVLPLMMIALLALLLIFPRVEGEGKSGVLFYSTSGPGAMHAALVVSLCVGLLVGFLAQRSRFCIVGAFRDLILFRQMHLFFGVVSLLAAAFLANLAFAQFHPGFEAQPIAHTQTLWNFAGMALAGLAFALAGGCPGRQLFLAGEGDGDAAMFVLGMIVGAAFAHNFGLAATPDGVGPHSVAAVVVGLVVCLGIAFTMRERVGTGD
ncbi:MAG: YedE family putative selenium transporter [Planctomycetota bacterium]|jgi:YedE family putative selenium metabolism protein